MRGGHGLVNISTIILDEKTQRKRKSLSSQDAKAKPKLLQFTFYYSAFFLVYIAMVLFTIAKAKTELWVNTTTLSIRKVSQNLIWCRTFA